MAWEVQGRSTRITVPKPEVRPFGNTAGTPGPVRSANVSPPPARLLQHRPSLGHNTGTVSESLRSMPTTLRAGGSCPHRKDTGQGWGRLTAKGPCPHRLGPCPRCCSLRLRGHGSWTLCSNFLLQPSLFLSLTFPQSCAERVNGFSRILFGKEGALPSKTPNPSLVVCVPPSPGSGTGTKSSSIRDHFYTELVLDYSRSTLVKYILVVRGRISVLKVWHMQAHALQAAAVGAGGLGRATGTLLTTL